MLEVLRSSDVTGGERLRVGVVESIDVINELLGMIGDVPGVDEVEITGV